MSIMKQKMLYAIIVIVIVAVALIGWYYFNYTGSMICRDEFWCGGGGGGYRIPYYWNCSNSGSGRVCSSAKPTVCSPGTNLGRC